MHHCSAYRCVCCNFMQIISIFSSLFTDYPHMPTPRRNHTIRLLLQYLDEEALAPTPTSLLPSLLEMRFKSSFRLLLSLSFCQPLPGPMRPPEKLTAVSVLFPFSALTLCGSSSHSLSHNRIAHFFPIDKRVRGERVEEERKHSTNFLNPIDLLWETFHWEFILEQK